jgi:hypothetical protein
VVHHRVFGYPEVEEECIFRSVIGIEFLLLACEVRGDDLVAAGEILLHIVEID